MRVLVCWNALPEQGVERIRRVTGVEVVRSHNKTKAQELIADVDVVFGYLGDLLQDAVKLQWMQVPFAGVEKILAVKWGNPQLLLTNGRGLYGVSIAEQVIGMLLSFNRGLHIARDHQKLACWDWDLEYKFRELTDATVGILGFGDIGTEIAKRLQPFNPRVVGIRRNPAPSPYAHQMVGVDQFDTVLPQLDYLICCLPQTKETVGLIDARRIKKLPNHAIIINVGRGSLIQEADLVEALQQGLIAGAGLDVTAVEPLPRDHPLWDMSNVILTPHNSNLSPTLTTRATDLFLRNWERFISGQELINLVNVNAGY